MADAHAEVHHDYHLVNPSPWPAIGATSAFLGAVGAILWMHHTVAYAPLILGIGTIVFIASEVMFFVAWFWAYFNTALFPDEFRDVARIAYTSGVWPPKGVETFDPWHLPLLHTLILLTSR